MADEKRLIKKAQKGDVDAFQQILTEYQSIVYNISYRYAGNFHDASDMAQEVFLKMFRSINSFRFQSKFSTWIYRVATNTCLDLVKKQKKSAPTVSIDDRFEDEDGGMFGSEIADSRYVPEDRAEEAETRDVVNRAIGRLPDDYKTVIILRDVRGLSYDEIAEITECSVGTVKSRISRARKNLREILLEDRELFEKYFV